MSMPPTTYIQYICSFVRTDMLLLLLLLVLLLLLLSGCVLMPANPAASQSVVACWFFVGLSNAWHSVNWHFIARQLPNRSLLTPSRCRVSSCRMRLADTCTTSEQARQYFLFSQRPKAWLMQFGLLASSLACYAVNNISLIIVCGRFRL